MNFVESCQYYLALGFALGYVRRCEEEEITSEELMDAGSISIPSKLLSRRSERFMHVEYKTARAIIDRRGFYAQCTFTGKLGHEEDVAKLCDLVVSGAAWRPRLRQRFLQD